MLLKKICLASAAVCLAGAAFAQPAGPSAGKFPLNGAGYPMVRKLDKDTTYISAADVAAMIAMANKEGKSGAPLVVGDVLKLKPYNVDLEYHEKGNPTKDVGLHPKEAEYVYVVQGAGVMVTGGTMTADRMHIDGGQPQKLSKGDVFLIPPNTPHLITRTDRNLAMISMHVPMPGTAWTAAAGFVLPAAPKAAPPGAKFPVNGAGYPMVRQLDKDKTVTYDPAKDIASLLAQSKQASKAKAPMVVAEVLKLDPYTTTIEYHLEGNPLADVGVHPKDIEYLYVMQGGGTLVTGGTRSDDHMSIEGGNTQKLSKGDFIIIPEGTPHWISHVDRELAMMSIHAPRPVLAQ